jgi:hypothetical protein
MRFARHCLLEHLCSPDHPILNVEAQLLAEAKQILYEFLLFNPQKREDVEAVIKRIAINKATQMTENSEMRRTVLATVYNRPLDNNIFPSIN